MREQKETTQKNWVRILFPTIFAIQTTFNNYKSLLAVLREDLSWTMKLYSFVFIIPITISILNILVFLLGNSWVDFIGNFKWIWIDYFYSGTLFNIIAWRCHMVVFILSYLFVKFSEES